MLLKQGKVRLFSHKSALALLAIIFALNLLPPRADAEPQPIVQITGVQRMQPGWVRVYLKATSVPAGAHYQLFPTCAPPTDPNSIVTTQSNGINLAFDIKVNRSWLAENSLPTPCRITQMNASMQNNLIQAHAQETLNVPMDLPLSLITPQNTPTAAPTGTSVSLAPNTAYLAYPPLIVAVISATGKTGFAEVEELPSRGTVGLRELSVFYQGDIWREYGGGAEILPGWGLDINTPGIWRAPQLPVETTHSGHDVFPYTGTVYPPILSPNASSLDILPAPGASDYATYVLNNRGVPRCSSPTGCMDFTYNATAHTLNAVNGARIALAAPPAIQLGAQTNTSGPPPLVKSPVVTAVPPAARKAPIRAFDPSVSQSIQAVAQGLATAPGRNLSAVAAMPSTLASSSAHMASNAITRDRSLVVESPQEIAISQIPRNFPSGLKMGSTPAASCVVNSTNTGVTQTPTACLGLTAHGFACPTLNDPIKVESLTPSVSSTDLAAALNGTIPPYYAGRDNIYGTCGSHAATQNVEALFDRYSDDLAIKRIIYVNGDAIVVPEPRVALSVTGGLVQLYTWQNTHTGDPGNNTWPPAGTPAYADTSEAYWPAREGDWAGWNEQNAHVVPADYCSNFWGDGFCIGQGRATPVGYDQADPIPARS